MPRKFHNDDLVRIRYYSRSSSVLGVGTVVDYISSKRKYLVMRRIRRTPIVSAVSVRTKNTD